jgi:hypothetical protein
MDNSATVLVSGTFLIGSFFAVVVLLDFGFDLVSDFSF